MHFDFLVLTTFEDRQKVHHFKPQSVHCTQTYRWQIFLRRRKKRIISWCTQAKTCASLYARHIHTCHCKILLSPWCVFGFKRIGDIFTDDLLLSGKTSSWSLVVFTAQFFGFFFLSGINKHLGLPSSFFFLLCAPFSVSILVCERMW